MSREVGGSLGKRRRYPSVAGPKVRVGAVEATHQQLRAFTVLAEELSFRRAAELLFISQPALSQSIKQLERALGVPLFTRDTRHVALTPAGADFAQRLRPALSSIDEAVAAARRWADGTYGVLRMGYLIGAGLDKLPKLLRQFSDQYPDIRVETIEFDFSDPTAGLSSRAVDLAVVRPPIDVEDIEMLDIAEEGWVACLPTDHRLARRRRVKLFELFDDPIIAAPSSAGTWRDYWIAQDYRGKGFAEVAAEAATFEAEFTAVAQGKGISITMASAPRYYKRPGVTFVPISDAPTGVTALAWPTRDTAPSVQHFVDIARES